MSLFSFVFFLLIDRVLSYSCSSDKACIFVDNQCPFPLYLQRTEIDGNENAPTTVATVANTKQTVLDITGWKDLSGQRLYAWWQNPIGQNLDPTTYRDKVEINWRQKAPNEMRYRPTAVDYFGLPVKIGPYNSSDCPFVPITGAYNIKSNEIQSQCPTAYVVTNPHGVCLSPKRVCLSDETNEICSKFDTVIEQCVEDGKCNNNLTTTQVYACSESMSQSPQLCVAINRGMYSYVHSNLSDTNHSLFYKSSPYNEYAKFIHTGNAQEYAFPYDDYFVPYDDSFGISGASGYESCDTNFLSVTFCPGSSDVTTTIEPISTSKTPSVKPATSASKEKERTYGIQDIWIAVCFGCVFGVVLTLIVMLLYNMYKRKKHEGVRISVNERLLGYIEDDHDGVTQAGAIAFTAET